MESSDYVIFHNDDANIFCINLFGLPLSLRQLPSARNLGHGAVVWEASAIFSKYMENNSTKFLPSSLQEKTVLELGSGCGLGGLAFMLRGARVVLTDLDCVIDSLTRVNAMVSSKL
jgi:predicted nicotinamide N-methyase